MAYSIIGFHYSVGGAKDGTGGWITNANSKGIPVGLKGADDAGLCFEGQKTGQTYGVNNWLVYRVSTAGQNNGIQYDVPDYLKSPQAAAQEHFNKTAAKWPPELDKAIVWSEPINEPRAKLNPGDVQWNNMNPVDWLGWFMLEYAMIANAQGFKVCGPSFNSGEPEVFSTNDYEQPGMVAYLSYCANNPTMAALAVHEYIWNLPAPQYPQLWGRFEAAVAAADLAGIPRTFPIFITEWGYSPSNAPTYPAVIPDLDKYNQICAKFPQVKFAAAWTLQSGYDPVDDQVITWLNYPIDKQFDPGPQPAATAVEFGSTLPSNGEPPMPTNLLRNADFEGGWFDQPTGQVPNEWVFQYYTGDNPYDPADYVKPETRVIKKSQMPAAEWSQFGLSGVQAIKAFKGSGTWHGAYIQTLSQPLTGNGKLTVRFFADLVASYSGGKTYATYDQNNPAGQIRVNGGDWQLMIPGEINTFVFELPAGTSQVKVESRYNYPLASCGIFADGWTLELVDVPDPTPPPPPPTGTFEERLWDASIIEQDTNGVVFHPVLGLWKKIKADGLDVVTHERGFEGVNYQVGALPDGERWVYTWTAAAGIKRFKWPADAPTPPPPGGPAIIDVIDQLAKHPTKVYKTRPLSAITTLTIHHSVSGGGANPLAEVISIANYHVNTRDWPGIGYHFCIGANGSIYVVNLITTKSFHAGSYSAPGDENYWSVGICLLGNFTDNPPPQAQLDAARSLVAYLKGQLQTVTAVIGHKAMPGASTACPGNTSPQWLGYVAGAPPAGAAIDLLPYLKGDGRLYTVKHSSGAQENFQTKTNPGLTFDLVKNSQYESFLSDEIYIWRGLDTSPGPAPSYAERPGALRYYRQFEPGQQWARWVKRNMVVGEMWTGPGHTVQFGYKSDCAPSDANSGAATNKVTLVAKHASKTWNGVTVNDVIELLTGTGETMFFGRGWGLVAWAAAWGSSAVLELVTGPDLVKESGCFNQTI